MISLAVAPSALAGPAGDEYLPKIPHSGGHSASSGSTATTAIPADTSGSSSTGESPGNGKDQSKKKGKKGKKSKDVSNVAPASSGSSGSGGDDSSGSILLNPIVLLMIALVIAAVVGMTLRRRKTTGDSEPGLEGKPRSPAANTPRTPDGEIVAGSDKTA